MLSWVGLHCVVVVFPDHTHLFTNNTHATWHHKVVELKKDKAQTIHFQKMQSKEATNSMLVQ